MNQFPLRMTLTVNAIADRRADASADFGHTAFLPPIQVTDANGNYVRRSEALAIVGDSGSDYPVVAAPEPSAAGLAACGVLALLANHRRGRGGRDEEDSRQLP